jgi:hypothetical protein
MAWQQMPTKSSAIWLAAFCKQLVNAETKSYHLEHSP